MALPVINRFAEEESEVVLSPNLLKIHIRIPSELEYLQNAILTLRGICEHLGISEARTNRFVISLEEVLLNAIEHAYPRGEGIIDIEFVVDNQEFKMVIQDYGRGFLPNTEASLASPEEILCDRGRGLHIIQGIPDKVVMGPSTEGNGSRTIMLFYLLNYA